MRRRGELSPGQRAAVAAIGLYRRWISPLKPRSCRFLPTCSEYAARAVTLHGLGTGTRLAVRRILRCHPWHPAAHDPVPEPEGGKSFGLARADRP